MRPRIIFLARGALGASLLLAACGDSGPPTACGVSSGPVLPMEPCWPVDVTPGGQVELGTGDITFEPLPDTLEIITSSAQSDPFVNVHARIRDLPPGNPCDIFDPHNPRTKVRLVVNGLTFPMGVDCPATLGYTAARGEPGAFDLVSSLHVGFGDTKPDQVSGMQAQITVEVVGSDGRYAKDEKLVTLMAP
jgi:hypothetical protein